MTKGKNFLNGDNSQCIQLVGACLPCSKSKKASVVGAERKRRVDEIQVNVFNVAPLDAVRTVDFIQG